MGIAQVEGSKAEQESSKLRQARLAALTGSGAYRMALGNRGLITAVALALAAASASGRVAYSLTLKDAKPHNGVAAAHAMPIQGIDVSYWQGDIDWQKVRDAGVQFAFIKATEGGDHIDPKFLDNWQAAKRAGVARGAYHFMYWCRPAHEQALWFMLNVPGDSDALPPVLDVEWNSHSKTCPGKLENTVVLLRGREVLDGLRKPHNIGSCKIHIACYDKSGTFIGTYHLEPGEQVDFLSFPSNTEVVRLGCQKSCTGTAILEYETPYIA